MLVPIAGNTVNGAKRWIGYGIGIQPSEFLKPGFVVLCAWAMAPEIDLSDDDRDEIDRIATPLVALSTYAHEADAVVGAAPQVVVGALHQAAPASSACETFSVEVFNPAGSSSPCS